MISGFGRRQGSIKSWFLGRAFAIVLSTLNICRRQVDAVLKLEDVFCLSRDFLVMEIRNTPLSAGGVMLSDFLDSHERFFCLWYPYHQESRDVPARTWYLGKPWALNRAYRYQYT